MFFLQDASDAITVVQLLWQVGMSGALIIGGGIVYFLVRKNGKESNGALRRIEHYEAREAAYLDQIRRHTEVSQDIARDIKETAKEMRDMHQDLERAISQMMNDHSAILQDLARLAGKEERR